MSGLLFSDLNRYNLYTDMADEVEKLESPSLNWKDTKAKSALWAGEPAHTNFEQRDAILENSRNAVKQFVATSEYAPNDAYGQAQMAYVIASMNPGMDIKNALKIAQGGLLQKELNLQYERKGGVGAAFDTFRNGYWNARAGEAFSLYMMDPNNTDALALAEKYFDKALSFKTAQTGYNWFTDNVLMPYARVSGVSAPGSVGATAIMIGGKVLSAATGYGWIFKLAKAGASLYSGARAGMSQAGMDFYAMYREADANGQKLDMTDPFVRTMFLTDAMVMGVVEVGDFFWSPTYRALSNILTPTALSNAFAKSLWQGLRFTGGQFVFSDFSESAEEFVQGIAGDAIRNAVYNWSNTHNNTVFPIKNWEDIIIDATDAFTQTTVEMIPTVALNMALTLGVGGVRAKSAAKNQTFSFDPKKKQGVLKSNYIVGANDIKAEAEKEAASEEKAQGKEGKLPQIKIVQTDKGAVPATTEDRENLKELYKRNSGKENFDVIIEGMEIEDLPADSRTSTLNSLSVFLNKGEDGESAQLVTGYSPDSAAIVVRDEQAKAQAKEKLAAFTGTTDAGDDYVVTPAADGTSRRIQILTQAQAQAKGIETMQPNDWSFMQMNRQAPFRLSQEEFLQQEDVVGAFETIVSRITGKTTDEIHKLMETDPDAISMMLPEGTTWENLSASANFMPILSRITGRSSSDLLESGDITFNATGETQYVDRNTNQILDYDEQTGKVYRTDEATGRRVEYDANDTRNVARAAANVTPKTTAEGRKQYNITINKDASADDIMHELMHVSRSMASKERLAGFNKAYGATDLWTDDIRNNGDGTYTFNGVTYDNYDDAYNMARVNEERFVRDFMDYLATGEAPNAEIKTFFDRLKRFIREVVQRFRDMLSQETVAAFDRLLDGELAVEPSQTIDAAVRASDATLTDAYDYTEEQEDNGLDEEGNPIYSLVDQEKAKELEADEHKTAYRSMQIIDGKLYPPMATFIGDKSQPQEIGKWYQSDENPGIAYPVKLKSGKTVWKFDLKNGYNTTKGVDYNPYFHATTSPFNDQFTGAYNRPNLVLVEVEMPVSDLGSGYQAEKASKSVGETPWHSGTLSAQLRKAGKGERTVFLSRYNKITRIVPNSEVASKMKDMLEGTDFKVPYRTVNESLRTELEKLGVEIDRTDMGKDARKLYSLTDDKQWQTMDANTQRRIDADYERTYNQYYGTDQWMKAPNGQPTKLTERQWVQVRTPAFKEWFGDWENDPENASKIVDENGEPKVVFRGDMYMQKNDNVSGLFVSMNRAFASGYGPIYELFVNARNPFYGYRDAESLRQFVSDNFMEIQDEMNETFLENYYDEDDEESNAFKTIDEIMGSLRDGWWTIYEDSEIITDEIRRRGYDAIYIFEESDNLWLSSPNQIKSATGNTGAFSQSNDNILYSIAPPVDSQEFHDWFDGSKVVDENGNPMVVYHGSPIKGINEFMPTGRTNNGDGLIYATNEKTVADIFAKEHVEGSSAFRVRFTGNVGETYPLYMDMKHPLDFRNLTDDEKALITKLYAEDWHLTDEIAQKNFDMAYEAGNHQYVKDMARRIVNNLEAYGYDGLIANMLTNWQAEQDGAQYQEYAVPKPEQVRKMAPADLPLYSLAYHGSGADFDEFLENKIGSGQGSQSFGYGFYFSESDLIGKDYARMGERTLDTNNQMVAQNERHLNYWQIMYNAYKEKKDASEPNSAEQMKWSRAMESAAQEIEYYKKEIEHWKNRETRRRNLYKVEIPDSINGAIGTNYGSQNYIVWDRQYPMKDLKQLSEELKKRLPKEDADRFDEYSGFIPDQTVIGSNLYGVITNYLGSQEAASNFLADIGYEGITYKAGQMMGLPDGVSQDTWNYVIFPKNKSHIKMVNHWTYDTDEESETLYSLSPEREAAAIKARKNDIQYAVGAGIFVRTEFLREFEGEDWADAELELRDYMKDHPELIEKAKRAKNLEDFKNDVLGKGKKKEQKREEESEYDDIPFDETDILETEESEDVYPEDWDDFFEEPVPEEVKAEDEKLTEDWLDRIYDYSNAKSMEDRDRQFSNEWTSSEDKTLELGAALANYSDAFWKSRPNSKQGGRWYTKNVWGAFEGVSTKLLRLSDGKGVRGTAKGRSTSAQIQEVQDLIRKNPRPYRTAYNAVQMAESRAADVRSGMATVGMESDYLRLQEIDDDIAKEIAKIEADERAKRLGVDYKTKAEDLKKKLRDAEKDLEKAKEKANTQISDLRSRLRLSEQREDDLKTQLKEAEKDLASAEKEYGKLIEKMGGRIEEYQEKAKNTKELERNLNDRRARVEQLRGQLTDANREVRRLTSAVNAKTRQLEAQKATSYRNKRIRQILRLTNFNNSTIDASFEDSLLWIRNLFDRNEDDIDNRRNLTERIKELKAEMRAAEDRQEDTTAMSQKLLELQKMKKQSRWVTPPAQLAQYYPQLTVRSDNRPSMWSAEELDNLLAALKLMRSEGKQMLEAKQNARRNMRLTTSYDYFREVVGRPAQLNEEDQMSAGALRNDVVTSLREAKDASLILRYGYRNAKLQRLARILDGDQEGVLYDWFVRRNYHLQSQELEGQRKRYDAAQKVWKELGIKADDLAKEGFQGTKQNGTEYSLSRGEMLGIYIYAQSELGMEKLTHLYGNEIKGDDIQKIINDLTPQETAWADFMLGDFVENYPRLRETYYRGWNMNLGERENYFTLIPADSVSQEKLEATGMDPQADIVGKDGKAYTNKSFTKAVNPNAIYPLDLDVTKSWYRQVAKQEHFIAYGEWAVDTQYLFDEKGGNILNTMSRKFDRTKAEAFKEIVNNVIGAQTTDNAFDRAWTKFLAKRNSAVLIGNTGTILKQAPSWFAAFNGDIDPAKLVVNSMGLTNPLMEFLSKHPDIAAMFPDVEKATDFIYANAPEMKNRQIDIDMAEALSRMENGKIAGTMSKVGNKVFKATAGAVDKLVVNNLWMSRYYTVFDQQTASGKTDIEAHREAAFKASQFISETQPTAMKMDQSAMQIDAKTSSFLRAIMVFTNQVVNTFNQMFFDIPMAFRRKEAGKFIAKIISTMFMLGTVGILSGKFIKREGEDDDKYKGRLWREILATAIQAAAPGFGSIVATAIERGDDFSTYIFGLDTLGKTLRSVVTPSERKTALEKWADALIDLGTEAGYAVGVPVTPVKNVVKTVKEKNPGYMLNSAWGQIIESHR